MQESKAVRGSLKRLFLLLPEYEKRWKEWIQITGWCRI